MRLLLDDEHFGKLVRGESITVRIVGVGDAVGKDVEIMLADIGFDRMTWHLTGAIYEASQKAP